MQVPARTGLVVYYVHLSNARNRMQEETREWDVIHALVSTASLIVYMYGSDLFLLVASSMIGNVYTAPGRSYSIDVASDISVAMACSAIVEAEGDGTPLYAVPDFQ